MATYGTDLVEVATGSKGESGTWTEFTGWASGGTPAAETENFIQGTQSQSQTFGNQTTGKSICFDALSDVSASIPTGDVVMGWVFMGAPTNLYSYASGGHRFGIGASVANFDMWYISGDDRSPNPYGGWWNVAIDPSSTSDATGGTGSAGAWRFFGSLIGDTTLGVRAKISKGNPHAIDGMLMGRGEIYATGTGGTFTLMAAENDLVANRWGLLQDTGGGTFLWKGLMSMGQTGTSLTFSDSNKTIVIDDCPKTYAAFNKIEFNHASTSVTWSNISFSPKGTFAPGILEMVDNCTLSMTGCTFNSFGASTFQSNATLTGVSYNTCGLVTQGGSTIEGCKFNSSSSSASVLVDDVDLITDCEFTSDGSNHAIEIDTPGTYDLVGHTFTSYATTDGSTGNEVIYNNSGGAVILNASGNTGTISVRNGTSATTSVVEDPVTTQITAKSASTGDAIVGARVLVWATNNVNYFFEASVSITGTGTTATVSHTAHGLATGDNVIIKGAEQDNYNGAYEVTVTGVDAYTYTTSETIVVGTATGTITSTFAFINEDTAAGGIASDSRTLSVDQPILGWVRKSSASPYYKQGIINDTVSASGGFSATVQLVDDE